MPRTLLQFFVLLFPLVLVGCGGGGGTTTVTSMPETPVLPGPDTVEPDPPSSMELVTLVSRSLQESNIDFLNTWDASPQVDLPQNGSYGLQVTRPREGGASVQRFTFQPALAYQLEPILLLNINDPGAIQRLQAAELLLVKAANAAYRQWTRHLNYDPGALTIEVGDNLPSYHNGNIAYYDSLSDKVVLTTSWLIDKYAELRFGNMDQAIQELFFVLSHEAAHQFGYSNPNGLDQGCGDTPGCHAPFGSGSVVSYDHTQGRSVRYNVTEEDVSHIPNATWNPSTVDRYEISKASDAMSIDSWGIWIDHEFEVSGQTAPGMLSGGDLRVADNIEGVGWIRGTPSQNVVLTGDATWSGQDNFLGVDLDPNYLGALLRADANLRYTFASSNLNLRVNNFEAHYSTGDAPTWHGHNFPTSNWGDFEYNMSCGSDGCMGDSSEANWYANDSGDSSGYVGGVVNDTINSYVGSFVAEKD